MISYNIKIGEWNYWIKRNKSGEYQLFVGDTLLVKSKDFNELHTYLVNQLSDKDAEFTAKPEEIQKISVDLSEEDLQELQN
jgi:hypothetical protein